MPQQVAKLIVDIIKKHMSLICQNMQTHCTNNSFYCFVGCVRERENYQQTINNGIEIYTIKNDAESLLEKVMPKRWRNVAKWIPKGKLETF